MKYRKRPIEVEALQIHGNVSEIKEFIGENGDTYFNNLMNRTAVTIHTLEGNMKATDGDYIIKGVKGEFYPCRKDIFEETYELVESGDKSGSKMKMVKLIIDIPKEDYDIIKNDGLYSTFSAEIKRWGLEAIRNGTLIEDKACNNNDIERSDSR